MNLELIFQIAGVGILLGVLHTVLKQAGKEEMAFIAGLAGVTVVLVMVVKVVADLFDQVQRVFKLY